MLESQNPSYLSPLPLSGYIISDNSALICQTMSVWGQEVIEWTTAESIDGVLESLLVSPPNIVILDMENMGLRALEVLRLLKGENVYRTVSVVLCLSTDNIEKYNIDWRTVEADDLLFMPPLSYAALRTRLELLMGRASRSLDTNPLTYLPGNNSIVKFVQWAISEGKDFALAYADLDEFKAFNDKYGFARGDEILMLFGRLISSTIHSDNNPLNFVGHVGGDDFIFCSSPEKIEAACKKIINTFDAVVPSFYDDDDCAAGMITSTDRQGNICTFGLMSVSIAVVFSLNGSIEHYGQAASRATQIKKKAKQHSGSIYILDQRKYPLPEQDGETE